MNLDYDLKSCLDNNSDVGIKPSDISIVLAVCEGENDGQPWYWVLQLNDGRFASLRGWCDYTGWDCQSGASIEFFDTARAAAATFFGEESLSHFDESPSIPDVGAYLYMQIITEKVKTWRERKDAELGIKV